MNNLLKILNDARSISDEEVHKLLDRDFEDDIWFII
jgi:hypothetical protein